MRGSGYGYADDVSIGLHAVLLIVRLVVLGAGVGILWLGVRRLRVRVREKAPP